MKVINIFGGPGCGKSTTAAGLFNIMKVKGYSVELLTEYAKKLTWHNRQTEMNDQLYITASQNHGLEMLRDKVDYVITDSPLLLGCIYRSEPYFDGFDRMVESVFDSYDNVNFKLVRNKDYVEAGRNQSLEEAISIDNKIGEMLYGRQYTTVFSPPEELSKRVYQHLLDTDQLAIRI